MKEEKVKCYMVDKETNWIIGCKCFKDQIDNITYFNKLSDAKKNLIGHLNDIIDDYKNNIKLVKTLKCDQAKHNTYIHGIIIMI